MAITILSPEAKDEFKKNRPILNGRRKIHRGVRAHGGVEDGLRNHPETDLRLLHRHRSAGLEERQRRVRAKERESRSSKLRNYPKHLGRRNRLSPRLPLPHQHQQNSNFGP